MSILTEDRVREIFDVCILKKGERTARRVKVQVTNQVWRFHRQRLECHIGEINKMRGELGHPPHVLTIGYGPMMLDGSQLRDRHGDYWTNHYWVNDQLALLWRATQGLRG